MLFIALFLGYMRRILAILCGSPAETVVDGEQDSQGPVGELADIGEAVEVGFASGLNLHAQRSWSCCLRQRAAAAFCPCA